MKEYKPISCSFYDYLEAFALKKVNCTIEYIENGNSFQTKGIIVDLFSKDKVEFLLLDNGALIRLDNLLKVNGISLKSFESC